MPRTFWLPLLALALLLPACGPAGRKPVYPVAGQVLDGEDKPAAGALVVFHPVEAGDPNAVKPLAYVDDVGKFALTTYDQGDGAPEGEYVVTIEWRPRNPNPFAPDKEGPDRLRGRYSDPKTSQLRFRVERKPDNAMPPVRLR